MNNYITKRNLWRLVNKRINRSLHRYHVFSVMSLLFEEMVKDFKDGKEFKICNFGKIILKRHKPRTHFHFKEKKMVTSPSKNKFLFVMNPYVKYYLNKSIDFEKTFGVKREVKNVNSKSKKLNEKK